jgi:hypothetical protein
MPGSFDKELVIYGGGYILPRGPLGLAAGETVDRLDIWVFQDSSACMGFLLAPAGDTWTMQLPYNRFGDAFRPGAAIGMGLIVKKNAAGEAIVEQWNRPINLLPDKGVKGGKGHVYPSPATTPTRRKRSK